MSKKLLIVESVHKSKAIQGFLGSDWIVKASVGHIRELMDPKKIPALKKDDYSPYSINTKNFDPLYEVTADRKKVVADLQNSLKSVTEVYWGTDPDREGEAIAWHLLQVLKPKVPHYRVSWQEVTKKAVEAGLKNRRQIDQKAVDASLSRSIYDRLFGFAISGNVQKTIRERSAGRVQSPALRLIVDVEKERLAFVKAEYKSLTGMFAVGAKNTPLASKLISIGERKIATGSSFDSKGQLKANELVLSDDNIAKVEAFLKSCTYGVTDVATKPYSRRPPMPYTTSSFQQDVGTRLSLGSSQIMSVAQKLFDNGYISYMRTDSPHLGDEALNAAYGEAKRLFPGDVPAGPTAYKAKGQGGHEAIRPTCDEKTGKFSTPASIKTKLDALDRNAARVYEAIYNRTVASQMNPAVGFTTTIKIESLNMPAAKVATFSSAATTITKMGWMALTKPVDEDEESGGIISEKIEVGDAAALKKLVAKDHSTTPPARYSEPKLVAKLEELGIGRPSTYASIVTVNQTRGYVQKKGGQLYPTWGGMKVAQYLEGKIPSFVGYDATALLEEELDKIEAGTLTQKAFLTPEWKRIQNDVLSLNNNINWDDVNKLSTIDLNNGFVVRVNSFGAFLEKDDEPLVDGKRKGVKLSDNENVGELDFSDAEVCTKIYEAAQNRVEARELGALLAGNYKGWTVTARDGKFGPFLQAVDPDGKAKPVNHALPEGVELETVELKDVETLFEEVKLPRFSPDGKIFVGIGKKGAYIGRKNTVKGKASFKPLPESVDPKAVTFDELKKIWDEG